MFHKILVCVSSAEVPTDLISQIIEIARQNNSTINLVKIKTAIPPVMAVNTSEQFPLMPSAAALDAIDKDAENAQAVMIRIGNDLTAQGISVEYDPSVLIDTHYVAKYARQMGAELIIMTAQIYKGWKRLMMGSAVEDVLRETNIPVLVVNTEKQQPAQVV